MADKKYKLLFELTNGETQEVEFTAPQGPTGPEGPQGAQGPIGLTGPEGPAGAKGDTGDQGPEGPAGKDGAPGATGPQGPQGPKGDTGETGPAGAAGAAGPKGDTGETGPAGPTGPKGDTGDTGPAGPKGDTGPVGPKGDTGDVGPAGPAGETGPAGADGYSPTVTLTRVTGGVQIAVQNKTGTQSQIVYDGKDGAGGTGGSGLPEPEGPHLQLVTDSEGNWTQVERLAYKTTETVEVLPETSPPFSSADGGGAFVFFEPFPAPVIIGNVYNVIWNGTMYTCTAAGFEGVSPIDGETPITMTALGNIGMLDGSGDTGEPFIIATLPAEIANVMGMHAQIMPLDGTTELTISITNKSTTYKKISFDYLPEGVGGKMGGVVLPEVTASFDENFAAIPITEPFKIPITTGMTYTVTWNGAVYECVGQELTEGGVTMAVLGNLGAMTGTGDTGEPFIIVAMPDGMEQDGMYGMALPFDGSETATFSISGETIKKIDPEYLDLEWVPGSSYVGEPIVAPMIKKDGASLYVFTDEEAAQMTEGTKIIVYVNDQRYESTMTLMFDMWLMAGNLSGLIEGQPDTGEPYLIWIDAEQQNIRFLGAGTDVVKFAIYKTGKSEKIPNKVPKHLLPDIGAYYVNIDYVDGKDVADRTFDEIQVAATTGLVSIICKITRNGSPLYLPYTYDNGDELYFSTMLYAWGAVYACSVCVQEDGTVTYSEKELK